MALTHVGPREVVSLSAKDSELIAERTTALVKAGNFELIRIVLPATKTIAEHSVAGPIVLLCLEGLVKITMRGGAALMLGADDLVHLEPSTPHALEAIEDSRLLLTVVFV